MLYWQIVFIFFGLISAINAELPKHLTKCKRSDPNLNLCLKEEANNAFAHFMKGNEATADSSLFPITYPTICLKPMDIDFSLEIKNVKGYGFDTMTIEDVNMDFKNQIAYIKLTAPYGIWKGTYKALGQIYNSTYDHTGELTINFANNIAHFSAEYELINFDGHFYMQLKNEAMPLSSDKITYELASHESKYLVEANDLMQKLNEKYPHFNKELIPTAKILTARVFVSEINNVLRTKTICNLFDD